MPRFLKRKKRLFLRILFIIGIVLICIVRLYIVALLLITVYILNRKVLQIVKAQRSRLGAKRDVESIDTLIIGDVCSDKVLNKFCSLDHCLKFTVPGRSLQSSLLLLCHLESVLKENGTVVIIGPKKKRNENVTLFDLPLISLVSSLELGINKKAAINSYPLIRHPFRSFRMLLGFTPLRGQNECPMKDFETLCKRKKFHFTYLE